jgi:SAM-dependent methyltransferase
MRTKIEDIVHNHLGWLILNDHNATKEDKQAFLDQICRGIVEQLSGDELCQCAVEAYNATVEQYLFNSHTITIIDDLIRFMDLLPERSFVLDVGCAYGRDTFFMTNDNYEFRRGLMHRKDSDGKRTSDKFPVPTRAFVGVGVDGSERMVEKANYLAQKTDLRYERMFKVMDIHRELHKLGMLFNGIWSCASLFTHTPHELLDPTLKMISNILRPDGIFFVSYTNGLVTGKYNKLVLSSTGQIKWFSQPDPNEIVEIAAQYGLTLIEESSFDDYTGPDFQEDLFVSHFFQKTS